MGKRLVTLALTMLGLALVLAGCDPQPPKDNSNIKEPPAPPPPGAPAPKK